MNFKVIKIGSLVKDRFEESNVSMDRACSFLKTDEAAIVKMFTQDDLSTDILLRWSKLLEYDFFRIYSQHLILYSPDVTSNHNKKTKEKDSKLPSFRKNIYTREIIDFIVGLIATEQKTIMQVIEEYRLPKTTVYKWVKKYQNSFE
ncbi:helix-turn-helix domain-containing protein [Chryseobacterium wanjuense]